MRVPPGSMRRKPSLESAAPADQSTPRYKYKPARELQVVIKIPYVYDYITKLAVTGTWH
jgi:hypothetical protein